MKKKLLFFIVAVLMLTLTAPAFAAEDTVQSTVIEANCVLPDVQIQVNVPTDGELYINPLNLPVEIEGRIEDSQIINAPAYIENKTEVPVIVSATVSGKIKTGSNMKLSARTTRGVKTTAKNAFIYFEMQAVSYPDSEPWDNAYDANKHIVVSTSQKTKKNIVTLGAADDYNCYGAFHLGGDCVVSPKSAWTEDDGLDVKIVFTFAPTVAS